MNFKTSTFFFFGGLLCFFLLLNSCKSSKTISASKDDNQLSFIVLQVNDIYEIGALSGGKVGGMPRLATLRKQLLAENPNTITILSGDFLNPSLLGTMKYEGERIKGKQMIELMNAVGIDMVCFGNHEFDLDEEDLQKRINESDFTWISTNVDQLCNDSHYPFYKEGENEIKNFFPRTFQWPLKDKDGTSVDIGFFGVTLPSPCSYCHFRDYINDTQWAIEKLESSDIILGITHLHFRQDSILATQVERVPLFMGGHDHDHMQHEINNVSIVKADANAKSAYVHRITINKSTGQNNIRSELVPLDENVTPDPETQKLVNKWQAILDRNISLVIDNPSQVLIHTDQPLDGRESTIRHRQSNLGSIITDAMVYSYTDEVKGALLNSGSIRIDDQISGDITPVDIFRALPFGGQIWKVNLRGDLLLKVLAYSEDAKGGGAYLQKSGIKKMDMAWMIGDFKIEKNIVYPLAINDFLLMGYDIPFLTEENPGIESIEKPQTPDEMFSRGDIRAAIVQFLLSKK